VPDVSDDEPPPPPPPPPPLPIEAPPPRAKKSDLMKPVLPFTLTFDHPAGLCSVTSTLVPATTVSSIHTFVDAEARTLTPPVVWKVA